MYSPDLCPNMIAAQAKLVYQLNKYYTERCQARKAAIAKTIREVCKVVSDVLKEVEVQEPRFISSLSEIDARYEGLEVISPTEFEVVLYLNQMGVFNFVDDGSLPGCAVLKLSDGRKRSMSLWVEFITASGYLSARKIRSRFQTLVAQAVDKCSYRDVVKMIADTSEVKLRIRERYVVQITPAFKCTGIWPRSAAQWPMPHRKMRRTFPQRPYNLSLHLIGLNYVSCSFLNYYNQVEIILIREARLRTGSRHYRQWGLGGDPTPPV